jgi:proteasome lid subunit RPN8/RPN11
MSFLRRPEEIIISSHHWNEMHDDVDRRKPEEACGLLAGAIGQNGYETLHVIPTANILHSSLEYRLDPQEQLDAFLQMEEQGWELVGIYHSHPQGPEKPSPTDIAEAYYPEAVYLIWYNRKGDWTCRGFLIQEKKVDEISVTVRDQDYRRNL